VTFSVKAGDTAVSATAATLNDIEFITYRDDLGGSVTRGPLRTPMAVYLTWRKAQTARRASRSRSNSSRSLHRSDPGLTPV